jgi:flagellar biosynthetic protein FlhB/flagellar biosynthetic protein FliR/FlhB
MSEKTEKATPHKLRKAKEKGQVSKSMELTTCAALFVMLGMLSALWPKQLHELQNMSLLQNCKNIDRMTAILPFLKLRFLFSDQ